MVILKGENEMGNGNRNRHNNRPMTKPVEEMTAKETVEEVEAPLAEDPADVLTENFDTEVAPEEEVGSVSVLKAKVSNCKKVRLRKAPSTEEDNVLSELKAGTEVVILDSSNPGWTRVDYNGTLGWIMADYLNVL
jgi:uncharacterized protein YgiM (DUF1202 family)